MFYWFYWFVKLSMAVAVFYVAQWYAEQMGPIAGLLYGIGCVSMNAMLTLWLGTAFRQRAAHPHWHEYGPRAAARSWALRADATLSLAGLAYLVWYGEANLWSVNPYVYIVAGILGGFIVLVFTPHDYT